MKKFIAGFLSGAILFSLLGAFAYNIYENPYKILVNGQEKYIQGYNVDDYSYFKLRDIADAVGGFYVGFQNDTIQISKDGYVYENVATIDLNNVSQRKSINHFLSTFSKNGLYGYGTGMYNAGLVEFAVNYNFNNETGKVYHKDGEIYAISGEAVNETLNRFLGCSVQHQTCATESSGNTYTYSNDEYTFVKRHFEKEIESKCLNIVSGVEDNKNGTFMVYIDQIYIYGSDMISNEDLYYSKDSATILQLGNSNLSCLASAVIRPKVYNGENTFELISYTRSVDI